MTRKPPSEIDALYGLDPVIDLSTELRGQPVDPFIDLQCPYCAEPMLVRLDLSAGNQQYVEDCQVCCQPMQIRVNMQDDGLLESVTADRMDR